MTPTPLTKPIALLILLAGCETDALTTQPTNNAGFEVGLLFEHEGCRVFRFRDGGDRRYFVRCGDGSAHVEWQTHVTNCHKVGKSTSCTTTHYDHEIDTVSP
jgi:hypothetical protein